MVTSLNTIYSPYYLFKRGNIEVRGCSWPSMKLSFTTEGIGSVYVNIISPFIFRPHIISSPNAHLPSPGNRESSGYEVAVQEKIIKVNKFHAWLTMHSGPKIQ